LINTPNRFILMSSLFFVISANWRFFSEVLSAFKPEINNLLFLASLPILLGCLIILIITLFSNHFTLKPMLTILFMMAALVAYFSDHYGTVIDRSMLNNISESDLNEVRDLFSIELFFRTFLLGILPIFLLWHTRFRYRNWGQELLARLGLASGALSVAALVVVLFSAHYTSFFREYKSIRCYVNPVYPLYSIGKYFSDENGVSHHAQVRVIAGDAKLQRDDLHRELMILVIGETARADHFSLYGYPRQTNPFLSQLSDLIVYRYVMSCGTSTAVSVPCIFSHHGRTEFDRKKSGQYENILDILNRAGVSVLWRDNNSSSKGVADRVAHQNFRNSELNPVCDTECRDIGMLAGLQEHIDSKSGDILIVLHQMGNHGPAYYKRYPPEFEYFKPACQNRKLNECTLDEIRNSYDNAIRYTDWFLFKVIDLLRANQKKFETMMIYVSDHGESLGENGLYLHGAPYSFAPYEQKHVPLLIWQGEHNDVDETSLLIHAAQANSHDKIFQTLLNFFEIESALTNPNEGLFEMSHDKSGLSLSVVPAQAGIQ